MSYHFIDINAPVCSISCKDKQIVCKAEGRAERRLPMEDIAAILVNSFSATFHGNFLIEAAKNGVVVILCENHRPVSLVLPANRSTDTLLTKAQLHAAPPALESLWRKTVLAKCRNQLSLAEALCGGSHEIAVLRREVAFGAMCNEANCAKACWRVIAKAVNDKKFTRHDAHFPMNGLLNYAYTVLMCHTLQKLMAVGLDPTFGIGHALRERSTPLAYDLMEPFRPAMDARIMAWIRRADKERAPMKGAAKADVFTVSVEYKKWIQETLNEPLPHNGENIKLGNIIEAVARSFRASLLLKQPGLYKPWIRKNSKWDGLS